MDDFFTRIEVLLKEQKKTQKNFAEAVGLSAPQAYITLRSRGTLPKVDVALRMAQYLNTSVEYLLTGIESDTYKIKYENVMSDLENFIKSH